MMILLILALLNLLFVAGFTAYRVIEEKKDATWGTAPRPRFKRWQPWA
jgi:hypothetical protein